MKDSNRDLQQITRLDKLFHPKSITIVGVSSASTALGGSSFLRRLLDAGYDGRIYPINPKSDEIQGLKTYPDIRSLPEIPDLAIVCIAAASVPGLLEECGRFGLRYVHILSAGFKEIGTQAGLDLENRIVEIADQYNLLVVGPNCMGAYCPASRLTAWGGIPGISGFIGIVSQSGGITQRLTEYLYSMDIGVGKAVSAGNATVLDVCDYLEAFATDPDIHVISLYLEDVRDCRRLLNLAREANLKKPIIILKGGASEAGARTVASHTGAMGGNEQIWNSFFKQTNVVRVQAMDEWADTTIALSLLKPPKGSGVFLAGGGGGSMTIASDICHYEGLEVPALSERTMHLLQQTVPAIGSIVGNPLDSFEIFYNPVHISEVADIVSRDPSISMIVVDRLINRKAFHLPDLPDQLEETIERLISVNRMIPTIVTVDSGGGDLNLESKGIEMRRRFCNAGIPAYPSPARAIRALNHYYRYYFKLNQVLNNSHFGVQKS